MEVALEVAVVHSGNLYGSDSFDVDGSAAVDGCSDVDVDHTPSPDLQDVAGAYDVVGVDLSGLDRGKGCGDITKEVFAEDVERAAGRAFDIGLEGAFLFLKDREGAVLHCFGSRILK